MSTLSAEFEYEIGEMVYSRQAAHNMDSQPRPFLVVERLAQECHGGIQRLYRLHDRKDLYPEVVLTREMPPYSHGCKARYAEVVALAAANANGQDQGFAEARDARRAEKESKQNG